MIDKPIAQVLPSSLELAAAESLRRKLQDKIRGARPIVLVGSAVERVSTPCLQVLVAASKTAAEHGLSFVLREPSKVLLDALADLGLEQALTSPDI
jgi:chemotaxis protein CheX